jgi:hypothetical protein
MSREKCRQRSQKALERASPNQRRGAADTYLSISKTIDPAEFCF